MIERAAANDRIRDSCGRAACAPCADELDLEHVRRRRERPVVGDDLADGEAPIHVPAEDRAHVVERAALEHRRRAMPRLLRRLEHDEHVARRPAARASRAAAPTAHVACTSCPQACITPVVTRRERQARRLLDRQRVDVAADGDDRRVAVATGDARDDAGLRDAAHVGDAERAQARARAVCAVRSS